MSSIRTLGLIVFAVLMVPIARTYSLKAQTAPATVEDAHILADQGDTLFKQKKYGESELLYRKVLDILLKEKGENHPDTASLYFILASSIVVQDRHADAEPLYRKALEIFRATLGENDPNTVMSYDMLAGSLHLQTRHAEAEPLYRKILEIRRVTLGEKDLNTALGYKNVAVNLSELGRYGEAEPLFRKALEIRRSILGENHVLTAESYTMLAASQYLQARFSEAEPLYRKALEIRRMTLGESDPHTATSFNNLASTLDRQGHYSAAEPIFRKALEIRRALLGENHAAVAEMYNNLASNLDSQGQYVEAESLYRKALDIDLLRHGGRHSDTATSYHNLATNLGAQGRWREAEPLSRRALDIWLATPGKSQYLVASGYNGVASNLDAQGRAGEAEPLYRKALDIWRAIEGEYHRDTATGYSNVAGNLSDQGRYKEADPLYRKALDIRRSIQGENHPDTAQSYNNVAYNLNKQGRYKDAEPIYRKALEISRAALGEDHPDTARSYNNIAGTLIAGGRYEEAEPLLQKALQIYTAVFGQKHSHTAESYNNLAANLSFQGRSAAAEPLYRKALDIFLVTLGENHSKTAMAFDNLANNLGNQGRTSEAEMVSAKAVESTRNARTNANSRGAAAKARSNFEKPDVEANAFSTYLAAAAQLTAMDTSERKRLQATAFRAAQDIISSSSAQAMADAAVRASAGTDALAAVAREQQDLGAQVEQIDKSLLAALGRGDTARAAQLRSDYDATSGKLSLVEARIDKDFPTYRELISPKPLELVDAQKALAPGEGLLVLVVGGDAVYSFALTPGTIAWNHVEGDAKTILKHVETIRCDVDVVTCSDEQKKAIDAVPATKAEQDGYQRFDLVTAHALYKALIAPVELALGGVNRLYVTSSGSLGDLPLGMLVTAPPAANADLADPDVLLSAQWLSDRYALTTLPAVSALRLRAMAKADLKPSTDFRGYGNPVLAPAKGENRGGTYYRGAGDDGIRLGDPDRLRTLPSLPGTETELLAMAALYPSGKSALTTGAGATESALKHDPLLKHANIIALATHGLLPSPGRGMDEPGLVFTPPKIASKEDDGILTASEVSQLSFLADWVILSACNTASTASGAGGSDSLSVLARAFLYAGAHALLASHWQVSDAATAALTVETLTARRDNPKLTRAQALQQAMHSVRTGKRPDGSPVKGWDQQWLHPSAWAPFSHIANSDE